MCDQKRTNSQSTDTSNDTVISGLPESADLLPQRVNGKQEYQGKTARTICSCTRKQCIRTSQHLVILVASVVISVVVCIIVIRSQLPETKPDATDALNTELLMKSTDLCFECSHLKVYVPEWAWQGVKKNRRSDKCCFEDKFAVMQTIKFVSISVTDS